MIENFIVILASIGAFCLLLIGWRILFAVIDLVDDKINKAKRRYKYKHRFDETPTAKCYCIDCVYYRSVDEYCPKYDFHFPDDGFCSSAIPVNVDITRTKETMTGGD